jgi:hypothetical protein
LRSNSSVWVFDASNLSFLREDHFDNPMLCVSLRLNPDLGIDLKRAPAVGVSHQFLYDLHVFPIHHQQAGKGVPKRVPAYVLFDPGSQGCRTNDIREQAIRPIGVSAASTRACEQPIIRLSVGAVLFPGPELGGKHWVHGHRTGASDCSVFMRSTLVFLLSEVFDSSKRTVCNEFRIVGSKALVDLMHMIGVPTKNLARICFGTGRGPVFYLFVKSRERPANSDAGIPVIRTYQLRASISLAVRPQSDKIFSIPWPPTSLAERILPGVRLKRGAGAG